MTTSLYIQCVAMFLLGQVLQIMWVKIPDIKKRAKIANQLFILKDWWDSDWNLVIGTFIVAAMLIIGLDQFVHWKPAFLEYSKWGFAFVGYAGSSVVLAKLSKYTEYFNQVIDLKTNKADGIVNPKP